MKKQRTIWLSDEEYKRLKVKAQEFFDGKGFVEKYLRKIINENVFFLAGHGKITISTE